MDQPAAATADGASEASAEAVVSRALAELDRNEPPEGILARLRVIDAAAATPRLRARYLRARAIATNRLGFPGEALGDLAEARRLIPGGADPRELGELLRTIALVHTWHGDIRDAALALIQATAAAGTEAAELAAVLAQGGRLNMEIGRVADAALLLSRALELAPAALGDEERERTSVNLIEALVAAGRLEDAQRRLGTLAGSLRSKRRRFLLELAAMRIAIARSEPAVAATALGRAAELVDADAESFSRIELTQAKAELALAGGRAAEAEALLRDVIARYAERADDLAPREIAARLLQAQACDALGRAAEAERTLAAGLRRALARGLVGYADELRGRIAARGGTAGSWAPGAAPIRPAGNSAARFVRRRPIASGGYGTVERAYDLELGIEVALKRILLAGKYDVRQRRRLLESAETEVAAASHIEHPGVAHVYGMLTEADGDALVIEELVEGVTLRGIMGGPVARARALDLLAEIAFALAAIHAAGIVHRDVKPENIILRDGVSPVLVDFGIAAVGDRPGAAANAGTRAYMAPEQSRGAAVDGRADLYSLGTIAHELLLGRPPDTRDGWWSRAAGPRRIGEALRAAGLNPAAAALIARLAARQRWRRPRDATQVAAQLLKAARGTGRAAS